MQQPRMIVLALIGTGLRYGFEMEEFARRTDLRQWAKIGTSTIYKVLADLEREGAVSVTAEESDKGPPRKAYALTDDGRARMATLIREALASDMSIYSDRIAGLVFAPLLGPEPARQAISASIAGLDRADAALTERSTGRDVDAIGLTVLDYYRAVYAAEREAMRRMLQIL